MTTLSIILSTRNVETICFRDGISWRLNLLVASFPHLHFQNRLIKICFLLCTKVPDFWCNTATHSSASCKVSGVAVPLLSTLIWIANFLKGRNWKAAECPANPDSRRGIRQGAGQSSQLVGENMKYWHRDTHKEKDWDKRENLGLKLPTQSTYITQMAQEGSHTEHACAMKNTWYTVSLM